MLHIYTLPWYLPCSHCSKHCPWGQNNFEINYWPENPLLFKLIECVGFLLRSETPRYALVIVIFLVFLTMVVRSNWHLISIFCPPTLETDSDKLYVSFLQIEILRMSNFTYRRKNLSQAEVILFSLIPRLGVWSIFVIIFFEVKELFQYFITACHIDSMKFMCIHIHKISETSWSPLSLYKNQVEKLSTWDRHLSEQIP